MENQADVQTESSPALEAPRDLRRWMPPPDYRVLVVARIDQHSRCFHWNIGAEARYRSDDAATHITFGLCVCNPMKLS
jgi:hypothetical protein